jgi:hypothetical protein
MVCLRSPSFGGLGIPNTTFPGDVLSLGTVATLDTASPQMVVRVLARLPNDADLLKSDMTGYAKIDVGRKPVWDVVSHRFLRWVRRWMIRVEVWSWIP